MVISFSSQITTHLLRAGAGGPQSDPPDNETFSGRGVGRRDAFRRAIVSAAPVTLPMRDQTPRPDLEKHVHREIDVVFLVVGLWVVQRSLNLVDGEQEFLFLEVLGGLLDHR